ANNNLLINEISQQQAVRGRVVDSQGAPLPGVTVSVMGTSQGALTDTDGNFALTNVPQNSTLQFSFVGMETREIPANEASSLSNVIMSEEAPLEEVVVVGYGTVRKRDLTGSISSVKAEDIPMTSVASVAHS